MNGAKASGALTTAVWSIVCWTPSAAPARPGPTVSTVAATVETVGPGRSGAALGVQQTMLQTAAVLVPLAFAPFISATSWGAGFAVAALFPLAGAYVLQRARG